MNMTAQQANRKRAGPGRPRRTTRPEVLEALMRYRHGLQDLIAEDHESQVELEALIAEGAEEERQAHEA